MHDLLLHGLNIFSTIQFLKLIAVYLLTMANDLFLSVLDEGNNFIKCGLQFFIFIFHESHISTISSHMDKKFVCLIHDITSILGTHSAFIVTLLFRANIIYLFNLSHRFSKQI